MNEEVNKNNAENPSGGIGAGSLAACVRTT